MSLQWEDGDPNKQGYLWKRSSWGHKISKRWFALDEGYLRCCDEGPKSPATTLPTDSMRYYSKRRVISASLKRENMKSLNLQASAPMGHRPPGKLFGIVVLVEGGNYYTLWCEDDRDGKAWCKAMTASVLYMNAAKTPPRSSQTSLASSMGREPGSMASNNLSHLQLPDSMASTPSGSALQTPVTTAPPSAAETPISTAPPSPTGSRAGSVSGRAESVIDGYSTLGGDESTDGNPLGEPTNAQRLAGFQTMSNAQLQTALQEQKELLDATINSLTELTFRFRQQGAQRTALMEDNAKLQERLEQECARSAALEADLATIRDHPGPDDASAAGTLAEMTQRLIAAEEKVVSLEQHSRVQERAKVDEAEAVRASAAQELEAQRGRHAQALAALHSALAQAEDSLKGLYHHSVQAITDLQVVQTRAQSSEEAEEEEEVSTEEQLRLMKGKVDEARVALMETLTQTDNTLKALHQQRTAAADTEASSAKDLDTEVYEDTAEDDDQLPMHAEVLKDASDLEGWELTSPATHRLDPKAADEPVPREDQQAGEEGEHHAVQEAGPAHEEGDESPLSDPQEHRRSPRSPTPRNSLETQFSVDPTAGEAEEQGVPSDSMQDRPALAAFPQLDAVEEGEEEQVEAEVADSGESSECIVEEASGDDEGRSAGPQGEAAEAGASKAQGPGGLTARALGGLLANAFGLVGSPAPSAGSPAAASTAGAAGSPAAALDSPASVASSPTASGTPQSCESPHLSADYPPIAASEAYVSEGASGASESGSEAAPSAPAGSVAVEPQGAPSSSGAPAAHAEPPAEPAIQAAVQEHQAEGLAPQASLSPVIKKSFPKNKGRGSKARGRGRGSEQIDNSPRFSSIDFLSIGRAYDTPAKLSEDMQAMNKEDEDEAYDSAEEDLSNKRSSSAPRMGHGHDIDIQTHAIADRPSQHMRNSSVETTAVFKDRDSSAPRRGVTISQRISLDSSKITIPAHMNPLRKGFMKGHARAT